MEKKKTGIYPMFSVLLLVLIMSTAALTRVVPASAQEMSREEMLIYAPTAKFIPTGNWNPLNPSTKVTWWLFGILEPLYLFDKLNFELIPWLASGDPIWVDEYTLEVKLKEAKWHDGQPFTAEDVKYTFDLPSRIPAASANFPTIAMLWTTNTLVSVEAVDDRTVHFTINETAPYRAILREALTQSIILPKHIFEKAEKAYTDLTEFPFDPPIGTGPYKFKSWSEEAVIKECWDDWWGKEYFGKLPAPKYLVFKQASSNEENLRLLIAGEQDWSPTMVPKIGELRKFDIITWYDHPPWFKDLPERTGGYMFNYERMAERFGEENARIIRHAIAYALDRQTIGDAAFFETAIPVNDPTWILPNSPLAYLRDEEIISNYTFTYDPEKAKTILEEAGIKDYDGDGIRELPDKTTKVTLDIYCVEGWTDWMAATEYFKTYCEAIGIYVETHYVDLTVWIDLHRRGEIDVSPYQASAWESSGLWLFFGRFDYRETSWPMLQGTPLHYKNDEFCRLRDEIAKYWDPLDPDVKPVLKELFSQIQRILARDLPWMPVWCWGDCVYYSTKYWIGWPTEDNPYTPAYTATWEGYLTLLNVRPAKEVTPETVTPVMPAGLEETINATYSAVSDMSATLSSLESEIDGISAALGGLQSGLYGLLGLNTLLTIVVIALILRKRK